MSFFFVLLFDKNEQICYHSGRRCTTAGGLVYTLVKGGGHMRITFHIGDFTVTIIVKKRENRHSGK